MERQLLKKLITDWKEQLIQLKSDLEAMGDKANTMEYNLKATEALVLSICINDATDVLLQITEKSEWGKE